MSFFYQKLAIDNDISYETFCAQINAGARIVIYQYCISPIATTRLRFSPAYMILAGEKKNKYQKKYHLKAILLGMWSVPGFILMLKSILINMKGGLDITDDIMLNIDEEAFNNRSVKMQETMILFEKVDWLDRKPFQKALKPIFEEHTEITKIIIGFYINTAVPYYWIGIESSNTLGELEYVEPMKKALYQHFRENSIFQFSAINPSDIIGKALLSQAEVFFER